MAAFEINLVGRFVIQGLVRSLAVVEVDVGADAAPRLGQALIDPEIDFLVFDRAPEALNEDVVQATPVRPENSPPALR